MVVRIVSKSYNKGDYYCKKVRLLEVHSEKDIVARSLDNAKILYNIEQRMLETVMPPNGSRVLILRGDLRGSVALLLSRDSKTEKAQVQLEDDHSLLRSFSFDDITQYQVDSEY